MLLTRSTYAFVSVLIRPISATTIINRRSFAAKAPTEMPGITEEGDELRKSEHEHEQLVEASTNAGAKEKFNQQNRPKYLYDSKNLRDLNFDVWPYRIERDWWKTGNRMTFWANWRQAKDVKQRHVALEYATDRVRWKAMKTNNILPRVIINEFQEKMDTAPKYANPNLIRSLCMFTGRRRGKFVRFRINRHIFREKCDSGMLSGFKRALW